VVERSAGRARFVYGSILEPAALRAAVEGSEIVFHQAAMSSVPRSIEEPERTVEVNAMGTARVLEAARLAGVRRVVYAASSSAYGAGERLPKVEDDAGDVVSPYAASKFAGEQMVRAWSTTYGIDGVSLRYFNIFGARQSAESAYAAVIAAFLKKLCKGERPVIYGDGSQSRDFTHVDNAVSANLLAATVERAMEGAVVNIGTGERMTVLELAHALARITGHEGIEPVFEAERAGDVLHSLADISKAEGLLGYRVVRGLEEGLEGTAEWYCGELSAAGVCR
jgi:UDP-glucose 4-epimerase